MTKRVLGLILVSAVGCQHEPPPAPAPAPVPVAKVAPVVSAAIDAAPSSDAEEVDDPNSMDPFEYAVRQAFDHKFPQLPMISADGKHVAIDLGYTHGMGYWRTVQYGWYGVDGKLEEKIALIDEKTADDKPPPAATLAAKAAQVWKKLDGYVALPQSTVDPVDVPDNAPSTAMAKLGATKLVVETSGAVVATWTDAHGKTLHAAKVSHSDGSGPGSCNGQPKLGGVWFDEPHMRVVLQVTFMGRDSCNDDPPEWRVF